MKRTLTLALLVLALTGCTLVSTTTQTGLPLEDKPTFEPTQAATPEPTPDSAEEDPGIFPREFYFASGVGAWGTALTVYDDGSFDGDFHDSDMGSYAPDYPGGIVYYCHFSGRFGPLEKVSDYVWRTYVEELEVAEGEDYIQDEIFWSFSGPYGMDDPDEILLYLPGISKSDVPEEFVNWSLWYWNEDDTLNGYGLYNVNDEAGFVAPLEG